MTEPKCLTIKPMPRLVAKRSCFKKPSLKIAILYWVTVNAVFAINSLKEAAGTLIGHYLKNLQNDTENLTVKKEKFTVGITLKLDWDDHITLKLFCWEFLFKGPYLNNLVDVVSESATPNKPISGGYVHPQTCILRYPVSAWLWNLKNVRSLMSTLSRCLYVPWCCVIFRKCFHHKMDNRS